MSKLSELMFSHIQKTPEDWYQAFPRRELKEGAAVTRFAPSPTGFLHIGGLFAAMISYRYAKTTDGVFILRIEDTDKKREIEDGVSAIVTGLSQFGIDSDEGVLSLTEEKGAYGPYTQSLRKEIYQSFVKRLVEQGMAYPCFCTEEELAGIRLAQEQHQENPGYYGKYAHCRNLTEEEAIAKIEAGQPYVVRLRSPGQEDRRITVGDLIRGKLEMPENIQDIVLLKTDGVPTYHFAHAVDDYLMGTTHVIRGDEWIASLPTHVQLFSVLGHKLPKYAHIAPVMKEENGGKRKLSKRKDPEATVSYYHEVGFPQESVMEYLMTLANSNFEEWRKPNPTASQDEFPFSLKKMSQSGALFDLVKLTDVSKNRIAYWTAEQVYDHALAWAKEYDPELEQMLSDKEKALAFFSIDRGGKNPRKDIAKWSEVKEYFRYLFDSQFKT
ncbi:MAG: glutamate--tRNA ligase, partial [Clostridia bacterium]|nr:glutamate--tRNA ligase [Clostridia bacterium]